MTNTQTIISGYHVEVSAWHDPIEGLRTSCFVTRGNYSASLAYLDDHGALYDAHDRMKPVNPAVIERIMDWALENGY